jgi:hypothetical protein
MRTNPDEPAPSLRPRYRSFSTTTGRSAGRRRNGTQRLAVSAAWRAPSRPGKKKSPEQYRHPPSRVPCESRRPGSRRLHAGHRLASKRVSARLIPELLGCPGSDATYLVSTRHQRFAHARLPDPRLTPIPEAFSSIAHHDGLQPTQHEAAWRLPPQGDAGEPSIPHLPHSTAIWPPATLGGLLAFAAHPSSPKSPH